MVAKALLSTPNIERKKITKLSVVTNKYNFIHSVQVFEIKKYFKVGNCNYYIMKNNGVATSSDPIIHIQVKVKIKQI